MDVGVTEQASHFASTKIVTPVQETTILILTITNTFPDMNNTDHFRSSNHTAGDLMSRTLTGN